MEWWSLDVGGGWKWGDTSEGYDVSLIQHEEILEAYLYTEEPTVNNTVLYT